jgi:iron(III) transport system ATP-binding protein
VAAAENLAVEGLVKDYATDQGAHRAVDGVSFAVEEGHLYTLLGPSGCGKTTTLRCVAGLETPDAGRIDLGGRTVVGPGVTVPTERRDIGMVFQSYAIWPHMTVAQNVAYPLEIRKIDKAEIEERVASVLRLVGLAEMAHKPATHLSGGQQQRAALARAIVFRPKLLLFDEPLSNLDLKLREQMRIEIKRIQREVGITSVYVTHDQAEALVMSDEIIVMSKGHIQQRGGPEEIYARPANRYVSNFIGVANLLEGRIVRVTAPGWGEIEVGPNGNRVQLPCRLGEGVADGAPAVLSIRPEFVAVCRVEGGIRRIVGVVVVSIFLGNCLDCRVRWGDFEWKVLAHPRAIVRPGDRVYLRPDPKQSLAVQP